MPLATSADGDRWAPARLPLHPATAIAHNPSSVVPQTRYVVPADLDLVRRLTVLCQWQDLLNASRPAHQAKQPHLLATVEEVPGPGAAARHIQQKSRHYPGVSSLALPNRTRVAKIFETTSSFITTKGNIYAPGTFRSSFAYRKKTASPFLPGTRTRDRYDASDSSGRPASETSLFAHTIVSKSSFPTQPMTCTA